MQDGDAEGDRENQSLTPVAPALLWKPERVAADLKLSRQLIKKLDKEKRIASYPLIAADELEAATTGANLTLHFGITSLLMFMPFRNAGGRV